MLVDFMVKCNLHQRCNDFSKSFRVFFKKLYKIWKKFVVSRNIITLDSFDNCCLEMIFWASSTSTCLDSSASLLLVLGKVSIASKASLAYLVASSLVLCIPRLFLRYSRACILQSYSNRLLSSVLPKNANSYFRAM